MTQKVNTDTRILNLWDDSYNMQVFAPGRIKEHFKLEVQGQELTISYTPPEGFPRPEWILRE